MSREASVPGFEIVRVVAEECWGEAQDPNEARDLLRQHAEELGGNAIVRLRLERFTAQHGCSNYRYTVHRFYGDAVILKKVKYSSDPQVIAKSEQEMRSARNRQHHYSVGIRASLVRPPLMKFVPVLVWSLLRTAFTVGRLVLLHGTKKALLWEFGHSREANV
ncbi:hypothetical protein [Herbidospora sp. NBRC 101105]|uniref:hypothetical protein n=1 Tax=Herbidospora sp. NBRC 101105 TaxID=3032195 RepID=UPI0024A1277D|nr:hypothetical protein [Herbidospora sp. NBRC 101105]GLX94543.1 hypothetical protein Hesp01_24930 [Herbidospora sp. NBRC 101105]